MTEQRGHQVAAGLVALVTLAVVSPGGVVLYLAWSLRDSDPPALRLTWADLVPWIVLLLVVLAAGLWWAWREGTGSWRLRRRPAGSAAEGGRTWLVPQPGAALWDSPGGTRMLARLMPGTTLVEVERQDERIQVTTADGRSGWVDQRSVL